MASELLPRPAVDPRLEGEYALRARHPERQSVYDRMSARSAAVRLQCPALLDQLYAAGPRCTLDFFPAHDDVGPAPLLVFVHGGYWRALDKSIFSYLAQGFTQAGIAVALPGYDLAPAVGLRDIADELEAALRWIARSAARLGVRRDAVVLAGHSAGAHLSALLAARTPAQLGGLDIIGMVGISGIYDLEPLRHTSIAHDVRIGDDELATANPIACTRFQPRHFVLAFGALETEGFKSQSRDFAARVRALGHTASLVEAPGRTHFDILDDLAQTGSALRDAIDALPWPRPATHEDPP